MGSGLVSEPEEAAPSSNAAGAKAGSASPRSGRQYLPLRGRKRFADVFGTGVRRRQGGVTVIRGPGRGNVPAVGIVASRRKVGGAVQRNRARRRIRAALDSLPLPKGSYIVIASKQVLDAPFGVLVRWLEVTVEKESNT
ncbi:MAG: hypothetical protein GWP04_00365 [Gammaproteobacteria bacterium]|nr:hypothetical protein [Gammaproteobacteria bacterium]